MTQAKAYFFTKMFLLLGIFFAQNLSAGIILEEKKIDSIKQLLDYLPTDGSCLAGTVDVFVDVDGVLIGKNPNGRTSHCPWEGQTTLNVFRQLVAQNKIVVGLTSRFWQGHTKTAEVLQAVGIKFPGVPGFTQKVALDVLDFDSDDDIGYYQGTVFCGDQEKSEGLVYFFDYAFETVPALQSPTTIIYIDDDGYHVNNMRLFVETCLQREFKDEDHPIAKRFTQRLRATLKKFIILHLTAPQQAPVVTATV